MSDVTVIVTSGSSVEVSIGAEGSLPTGGTVGQVLSKIDSANFNVHWETLGYFARGTDAANLTGTIGDGLLSANVTLQGNSFNGNSELVQLTAGGLIPALDGSLITNLSAGSIGGLGYFATGTDAANLTGTVANARLTANVTLQGNSFNGASQLLQLTAATKYPAIDGSLITNLSSGQISGLGYFATGTDAANLTGTVADARLTGNVTLQGNAFNGASELVQMTGATKLPAVDGSLLTGLVSGQIGGLTYFATGTDAANLTGTVANARLTANVTLQGNSFNGASQLIQTTAATKYPALDGSLITGLVSGQIGGLTYFATGTDAANLTGTVADARLTANVTLQGNSFNAASKLVQLTAATKYPAIDGSLITSLVSGQIGGLTAWATKAYPANAVGSLTNDGAGNLTWTPSGGGGTPGGSNTQLQYNNAGAFGGIAGLTWDGTTLASTAPIVLTNTAGFLTRQAATQDGVVLVGGTGGTSDYTATITTQSLLNDVTVYLPLTNGYVVCNGEPVTGPSSNSAGFLTNDGSGDLSWTTMSASLLLYGGASNVGSMPPSTPLNGTELLYVDQGGSDTQLSLANLFGGTFPVAFGFSLIAAADGPTAGVILGLGDMAYQTAASFAAVSNDLSDLTGYAGGNQNARISLFVDHARDVADTDITIDPWQRYVNYTALSAQRNVTLTSGMNNGQEIIIYDSSGNASIATPIHIIAAGTINGASSYDITTANGFVRLVYDGGSHFIVGSGITNGSSFLQITNNLSDLGSASTARTNLGLDTAATHPATDFLLAANNLSDVASPSTALANLGVTASNVIGAWTDAGGIPLTAVTTAPTKGTLTYDKCVWRRAGGGMDIKFTYVQPTVGSAANGSGVYLLTIPNGQSIDTSLVRVDTDTTNALGNVDATILGQGWLYSASANTFNPCYIMGYDATHLKILYMAGSSPSYWGSTSLPIAANGFQFIASLTNIPISGW